MESVYKIYFDKKIENISNDKKTQNLSSSSKIVEKMIDMRFNNKMMLDYTPLFLYNITDVYPIFVKKEEVSVL